MLGKEEIVSPSLDELKEHYHHILTLLGEDPEREGLLKTPERVAKAMLALTKGYSMDPHEVLRSAKFKEDYNQMVRGVSGWAVIQEYHVIVVINIFFIIII